MSDSGREEFRDLTKRALFGDFNPDTPTVIVADYWEEQGNEGAAKLLRQYV